MEEILRWMKATESNDEHYNPPEAFKALNTEFVITKLDSADYSKLLIGELVTLDMLAIEMAFFHAQSLDRAELLYWYQVKPTEQTWKNYFDGN